MSTNNGMTTSRLNMYIVKFNTPSYVVLRQPFSIMFAAKERILYEIKGIATVLDHLSHSLRTSHPLQLHHIVL